jgi:Flp pilus assembly protein TadD
MSPTSGPVFSARRFLFLAIAIGLILAAIAFWTRSGRDATAPEATSVPESRDNKQHPAASNPPEMADPRTTWKTSFRNVRPEVKYVGDAACAECHFRIVQTYRRHPMGRSLAPVAKAPTLEHHETAAKNPFQASGLRYQVEPRGERVYHKEAFLDSRGRALAEIEAEVSFAVGSGQRGRSYLVERDGYLFASPITWYPQKGIWDLSPGYDKNNPHFGRPISPDCLFCHANRVDPIEDTANRYRKPIFQGYAIGCERCHGPGELHVQRHRANDESAAVDDSIVNPRHLDRELREAVCQQCHLQGEERVLRRGRKPFDYRPGLPSQLFFVDFVKAEELAGKHKFVGTVEQMYASRCFQESTGREQLGCISCHDPHRMPAPEKKAAYYRARCLTCHAAQACTLPRPARLERTRDDSCIVCHMPPTGSDVNHTSITDHRIPRRPDTLISSAASGQRLRAGAMPLVPFPSQKKEVSTELNRDLGVALVRWADRQPTAIARDLGSLALPLLEMALKQDAADVAAWEAKGSALWLRGRSEEALLAYQAALEKAPRQETALYLAATLATRLKRFDAARAYAAGAVEVNPWRWQYHQVLANLHAQSHHWREARDEAEKALQLHPGNLATRKLLVECCLKTGDKEQAQELFPALLELSPANQTEGLRQWFERLKMLGPR